MPSANQSLSRNTLGLSQLLIMATAVVTARPQEALKSEEAPDLYSQLKSLQRQLEFLEIQARG